MPTEERSTHFSNKFLSAVIWGTKRRVVLREPTKTGLFGRGDPLPLNNNMPSMVVEGNRFHMFGSETEEAIVEGKHYEHRPNLYLIGTIAPIDERDWRDQIRFLK